MMGSVARLCYFRCMAERSTTLPRRRFLAVCSGACGDLGTFIPHVIGAITVASLAPAGVLFGFAGKRASGSNPPPGHIFEL